MLARSGALLLGDTLALAPGAADAVRRRGPCAAVVEHGRPDARVAVLSAFPAETAPLVEAADIQETVQVVDRRYHLGTLGGVRVVLGITGIGMVNATTTAQSVLDHFDVVGVVVSGVAGSPYRIGDVTIPATWTVGDGRRAYRVNRTLRALAAAAAGSLTLARCTAVPPLPPGPTVCLPHQPTVVLPGRGRSMDPFAGARPCQPGGGEVFGCELPTPVTAVATRIPDAEDMETAAIGRIATRSGVPWVAMRAVSDGAGDPLGLPGFPAQFFAYYRLAAGNAAAVTIALLERVSATARDPGRGRRLCARLAHPR